MIYGINVNQGKSKINKLNKLMNHSKRHFTKSALHIIIVIIVIIIFMQAIFHLKVIIGLKKDLIKLKLIVLISIS